ncbi:hypothetical protein [Ornithinimicrobium sediminis]|uniref:hypothetical protein n=1 Tax=Ornithinimicrobium sediminis TaxID=2904603 RepID=UPI001E3D73D5|nr:hypothetical protein [Ornithinimicrobium sediminis]MCE0487446.1 hypothetical protein [Ornithinimicrobium sediminis]
MHRLTALASVSLAALALSACGESAVDDLAGIDVSDGSGQEPVTDTADTTTTQAPGAAEGDAGLFGTAPDEGGPYGELRDGVWGVGLAGEVELTVTPDGTLELVDVRPAEGWDVTDQEETGRSVDGDAVELDLRRDGDGFFETWELDADLHDGAPEVEVDYEIEGTFGG